MAHNTKIYGMSVGVMNRADKGFATCFRCNHEETTFYVKTYMRLSKASVIRIHRIQEKYIES